MIENRILIVDDDPSWQELLRESIETVPELGPHTLQLAGSYAEADALLDRQHFHLAFVDLRLREDLRDLEGKKIVRKIAEQDQDTAVVIATGHADVSTAITALREWKVLDFILKDAWEPEKVIRLVQTGLPAARSAYRARFESASAFLAADRPILDWLADVLACVVPGTSVARPDRALGDFLNTLLEDLFPLLPERGRSRLTLDPATHLARARFWSKALGCPIAMCFGQRESVDTENAGLILDVGFARAERIVADDKLGIAGVIYVPAVPAFEAFAPQ